MSQVGAPCPDHLINTKHRPLVVDFDPSRDGEDELRAAFRSGVAEYAAWYRDYYERNLDDESRPFPIDPAGPRVVLVPGVGIVTSGADAGKARVARDLYHRAVSVEDAADAIGGFGSLSEAEAFAIEYWPLERYKLAQAPPRGELGGQRRRDHRRRERDRPRDRAAARRARRARRRRRPERRRRARGRRRASSPRTAPGARSPSRSTSPRSRRSSRWSAPAVLAYGGVDLLVSSAGLASSAPVVETTVADWERNFAVLARGYFLAAREVFRVLLEQGRGGSIVFVASKNALVAGANAAAYSSAKAASLHLARCLAEEGGPHGIRVNTVNPDAVIAGSGIWSSDWKEERASTYGVAAEDLPAFYRGGRGSASTSIPRTSPRRSRSSQARVREVHRQRRQRRRRRVRRLSAMRGAAKGGAPTTDA